MEPALLPVFTPIEKDWRTEPPPTNHANRAPQSDIGEPVQTKAQNRSIAIAKGPSIRIVIAATLTVLSLVVAAIGILPSNQYTRRGIVILVAALFLAVGGLASLFLLPRRSVLRGATFANSWTWVLAVLAGVGVVIVVIVTAVINSSSRTDETQPPEKEQVQKQVPIVPTDPPKNPIKGGPDKVDPKPKPKTEDTPKIEIPPKVEDPPKIEIPPKIDDKDQPKPVDSDVKALIAQPRDKDEAVRLSAAKALGRLKDKAKDAIPALMAALKDEDEDVRIVAQKSLDAINDALRIVDKDDPIKAKVDKAKMTYEAEMVEYRKAVIEFLDKRADDAKKESMNPTFAMSLEKFRKAATDYFNKREDDARLVGDKPAVDKIKIERKAFEENGDLPAGAPAALKQLQLGSKKAQQAIDAQLAIVAKTKEEKREFEEANIPPKSITAMIKQKSNSAASKLNAAYALAIREYTMIRKDDEATAVEKEMESFKQELADGAANSRARSVRWTILFRTQDGKDYIDQLSAFKAKIVVPEPPNWKTNVLFEDLLKPKPKKLENQILPKLYFVDEDAVSASKVARALGLDFDPPNFIAFFPKDVEDDLAAKEHAFKGLREDQIYSTTFRVTLLANGRYQISVSDQVRNRK